MTPEQQTPIVLKAMTLRGVRSYIHGARLDIKPLTVLCGPNGSGKSAWLKVLGLLDQSLCHDNFPFEFAVEDYLENIEINNAFFHLASAEDISKLSDPESDHAYGTPGTIGLEMVATRDFQLEQSRGETGDFEESVPRAFLWKGTIKAGTHFRLRLAHPSHWTGSEPIPELQDVVELVIDGDHVLRLSRTHPYTETVIETEEWTPHNKNYSFQCSAAFLDDEAAADSEMFHVTDVNKSEGGKCENVNPQITSDKAAEVLDRYLTCLRHLLATTLGGFFYLGAIRKIHSYLSLYEVEHDDEEETVVNRRHVGAEGEHSWFLERSFSGSNMRGFDNTTYSLEAYVSNWLKRLTDTQFVYPHTEADLQRRPTGFLLDPTSPISDHCVDDDPLHMSRLIHPCFGGEPEEAHQPPRPFSAGLHQVFPVIVQLGLMRAGELMGIENPEVHLHPSLQLQLTEALIAHVASGRHILIETHSDLVIRRILRAILEEDLPQSKVNIYFTELETLEIATTPDRTARYSGSRMNLVEVDQHGRIANWPKGFLDEDIHESQRLLDIMYGPLGAEEDDE